MISIELEEAISLMKENIKEIEETEEITLLEANNRILGEDIYAPISNPPFNRSPLDGYALIAEDSKNASKENPVILKVVDEVFAGSVSNKKLNRGEAIRIMTGAKMPEGADSVIRQECTDEGMTTVNIYEELSKYDNYCFAGEDINKGDLLMKKGDLLTYVHIGILSSMGYSKVKVKRKVKIGLLTTGDEVDAPGKALKEGKIYDSNLHLIYTRLCDFGFKPIVAEIMGDNFEVIAEKFKEIIHKVDVIITTGGVSVGKKDIFHEVIPFLEAKRIFWKVKVKPGTPAMFWIYKDKPILSLSGNPFASLSTFELLGRPILSKISGNNNIEAKRLTAVLEGDFEKGSKIRRFIRGRYEEGKIKLTSKKHASGMLASMIGCNALIDIKPGKDGVKSGEIVNIILL